MPRWPFRRHGETPDLDERFSLPEQPEDVLRRLLDADDAGDASEFGEDEDS